jgi:phasin family protein
MYQLAEQLVKLQKANIAAALRLAGIASDSVERLLEVQLHATRSTLSDGVQQARVFAEAKNLNELAQVRKALAQPALDNAANYVKELCDVAVATQSEISKLVEEQVSEFNRQIVNGLHQIVTVVPADSDVAVAAVRSAMSVVTSTYDNLSKAAKQLAETTHASNEGAGRSGDQAAKKKAA